jgi:hypothetical protein
MVGKIKKYSAAGCSGFKPILLATQEVEIWRVTGAKSSQDLISINKGWVWWHRHTPVIPVRWKA